MKRKLKLAFDQLEKELAVIPQTELSFILGGNGSGSSGSTGLTWNSSIDEVVDYLQDQGFPMSQDSSGNYYFSGTSGAIMLDEVVIVGQAPSSSGSSGGSGFNYSGYFSSGNSIMDYYAAYFASYGYYFTPTGGGNYTYNPPPPPPPPSNENDPWLRNLETGEILTTPTGRVTDSGDLYPNVKIFYEEVTIETTDGVEVTAYKVSQVIDTATGNSVPITDQFKSNCHGFAFGDGDLWFFDPEMPGDNITDVNDNLGFENMLKNEVFWEECSKADAETAAIWTIDDTTQEKLYLSHSAKVDVDGKYVQKDQYSLVYNSTDEDDFSDPYRPAPNAAIDIQVVYYKRKN